MRQFSFSRYSGLNLSAVLWFAYPLNGMPHSSPSLPTFRGPIHDACPGPTSQPHHVRVIYEAYNCFPDFPHDSPHTLVALSDFTARGSRSSFEMGFKHGNRLIDIHLHIGIVRKFALGPTERSESFLMIANIHAQESFVELRAFQIVELILSRLVLFIRFQLDVFLTGQRLETSDCPCD